MGNREPTSLQLLRAEQGPGGGKSWGQAGTTEDEELSNRQSYPKRTGCQLPCWTARDQGSDRKVAGLSCQKDVQVDSKFPPFPAEWLEAKA